MRILLTLPVLLTSSWWLFAQQPIQISAPGGLNQTGKLPAGQFTIPDWQKQPGKLPTGQISAPEALNQPGKLPAPQTTTPGGLNQPGNQPSFVNKPAISTGPLAAPVKPGTLSAVPVGDKNLTVFNPQEAQVKWVNGHWELHAGETWLKDFGRREREAREALNLIRRLRLTQRGTIGTPMPIMEYWLADGQAPRAFGGGLRVYPIDHKSLRVEELQGHWCLRDNRRLLFNFGIRQEDARQAIDVIRGYGFDQIGYVGYPQPTMIYFLASHNNSAANTAFKFSKNPSPVPAKENTSESPHTATPGDTQLTREAAQKLLLLQQAQLLAKGMQQLAPPPVEVVTRIRFDPREVVVRKDQQGWKLYAGQHLLANFGPHGQQAQDAVQLLQQYGCNEHCRIGLPEPTFSFFLASGRAPFGIRHELKGRHFQPDKIAVKQHQNSWYVFEGEKPLLYFGDRREDAQETVQAIQKYRFDFISQFGSPAQPAMSVLVRTR